MRIACFKGLLQFVHSCFMKLLKVFSYYFYLLCLGLDGAIFLKLHTEISVKRYYYIATITQLTLMHYSAWPFGDKQASILYFSSSMWCLGSNPQPLGCECLRLKQLGRGSLLSGFYSDFNQGFDLGELSKF